MDGTLVSIIIKIIRVISNMHIRNQEHCCHYTFTSALLPLLSLHCYRCTTVITALLPRHCLSLHCYHDTVYHCTVTTVPLFITALSPLHCHHFTVTTVLLPLHCHHCTVTTALLPLHCYRIATISAVQYSSGALL